MTRLRVGVYDLYWSTLGGGEQVAGTIASVLAVDHDVTLLGPDPVDVERTHERLGVDLSRCAYRSVADDRAASEASAYFDLFVNGTYLSRAVNHAPTGWYYVHFPMSVPDRWEPLRHRIGTVGVRTLASDRLPQRAREVRAGFDRRVRRTEFLSTYHQYLANSRFTADWTERLWGVPAQVLNPPVRTDVAAGVKRPLILTVGRFFDPRFGHSKKQLELIEAFERLDLEEWRLALAGGCDAANREYALSARRAAVGRPIDVHVNAKGDLVRQLFAEATIYWHAGGYGEDPRRHPERFEHFGITVLEAMAAGAMPLVYGAAGPAEIVEHGVNGYHWHDLDELISLTRSVVADPAERERIAEAGAARVRDFSVDRFASRVLALLTTRSQSIVSR